MKTPAEPQPLSMTEAVIPVASLVVLVALSYFLFGDAGASGPNQVALTVATMIAVFIAWRRGHSLESLREAATKRRAAGERRAGGTDARHRQNSTGSRMIGQVMQ